MARTLTETSQRLGASDQATPLLEAGLSESQLKDPEARIPFSKHERLWELLYEQTGDPDFGLKLGQEIRPASFSILGYIAINSACIGEAMNAFEKYQSLAGEGGRFEIKRSEDLIEATYTPLNPEKSITAQRVYGMLASTVSLGQWLVGKKFTPRSASFTTLKPENHALYEQFFDCPINWGADNNQVSFEQNLENVEIPHANHEILSLMLGRAKLGGDEEENDSTTQRLANAIKDSLLGQEPDKEQLAKKIGVSSRTLQRKLQKEGTSYQKVLDRVRHQLARDYLQQKELTITDVSYLLGYTDPSPFHRSFKLWEQQTPGQYRAQKLNKPTNTSPEN